MSRILVADDDSDLLALVTLQLKNAGHQVFPFEDALEAEKILAREGFDLVLTDLEMPEKTGIDLLKVAKEYDPTTVVVILTGHATVDTAVEAMKAGAFDYLKKPFPQRELLVVLEKGLRQRSLEQENRQLRHALREKYHFQNLVGNSVPMQAVFRLVERLGPTSSTALILGESGTGKELIARAIHETSPRSHRRFLKVNCTALTDTLLESELFGHEKGSFTGAITSKQGLFEAANGGTLFLDEVGDTSPALQAKLLRVLQEGEIRRVGGTDDIHVDVRVITATNRDLRKRIQEGLFREDLYFRLNVVSIQVPPLRERREDIPLLVEHFLRKKTPPEHPPTRLQPSAMEALKTYDWPGNVRELENVIERAIVLCEGGCITLQDLTEEVRQQASSMLPIPGPVPTSHGNQLDIEGITLEDLEKRYIQKVLVSVEGHRDRAAKILGITRRTLYAKIKKYGIEDLLP